jgi:hypothetical protein
MENHDGLSTRCLAVLDAVSESPARTARNSQNPLPTGETLETMILIYLIFCEDSYVIGSFPLIRVSLVCVIPSLVPFHQNIAMI